MPIVHLFDFIPAGPGTLIARRAIAAAAKAMTPPVAISDWKPRAAKPEAGSGKSLGKRQLPPGVRKDRLPTAIPDEIRKDERQLPLPLEPPPRSAPFASEETSYV